MKNPTPVDCGPFHLPYTGKASGLPWAQKIRVRPWPSTPVVAITTVPSHWEMAPPHLDAKLRMAFPRLQNQRGLSALAYTWLPVPIVFPTRGTVAGSGALQNKIHSPGTPLQVLQFTENLQQGKCDAVISQMFILPCKVSAETFPAYDTATRAGSAGAAPGQRTKIQTRPKDKKKNLSKSLFNESM